MLPACLCQNIVQTNVIAFHPAAVQPKDIKASVVGHQLIQLVTGKGLIVFPPVGMAVFLIIDVTVGGSEIRIPKPFAMPVGFGEIASRHETSFAESIEYMVGYILARIVLEGSVGNGEVRVFGVVSTKSVVMFGGEYHVFDTCILHYICPLFGIEVYRIERVFQAPVPLFVFIVWQRFFA